MKHAWIDNAPTDHNRMLAAPMRRCTNCGARQERVTHTSWMRVTGYQWLPLVGRCRSPHPDILAEIERLNEKVPA